MKNKVSEANTGCIFSADSERAILVYCDSTEEFDGQVYFFKGEEIVAVFGSHSSLEPLLHRDGDNSPKAFEKAN